MAAVLLVLTAFALFAVSLHLWSLIGQAASQVAAVGAKAGLPDDLTRLLLTRIDEGLLESADSSGLAGLGLAYREAHDHERTVGGLMETIAVECQQVTPVAAQEAAKHLYQLQQSIALRVERIEPVITRQLEPLVGALFLGRRIHRVELVTPGSLVDRSRMWPLTSGSRVEQPLGVVLVDSAGNVISKAKVICC